MAKTVCVPGVRMCCKECGREYSRQSRGLCYSCKKDPVVREKWGIAKKPERSSRMPLPDAPTDALPWTPEYVQVLAARISLGQQLFHPEDARPDLS